MGKLKKELWFAERIWDACWELKDRVLKNCWIDNLWERRRKKVGIMWKNCWFLSTYFPHLLCHTKAYQHRNSFCFNFAFWCFWGNSFFRQRGLLSAEIVSLIREFQPNYYNSFSKLTKIIYRNTLLWQKLPFSEKRRSLGSFCISAELNFFESLSFGFQQKEENCLSVAHWLSKKVSDSRE